MTTTGTLYWPYLYWQIGSLPTISCPPIGLVTRPALRASSCSTALKGNKTPYAHMSGTFALPEWLGSRSRIDSMTGFGRGDMKAKYRRSGRDIPGGFDQVSESIQAPGTSTASLNAKESVCETLYSWKARRDVDIRTQSCGRVDDPNNWGMIKRLCGCAVTSLSTNGETSVDPGDEGETTVKMNLESSSAPVMIYPITPRYISLYDEARFADYQYAPVVAAWGDDCGYLMPAVSGTLYPLYMAAYGKNPTALVSGTPLLPYYMLDVETHDNIVVAVLSGGSVYWSNDSGKTFYQSTGVTGGRVVSVGSYSNVLVGCSGDVYLSTDGGRTFSSVDPYGAVTGNVVAICRVTDGSIYVLDSSGMLSLSDDGGETFIQVADVPDIDNPTSMIEMDGMLLVAGYSNLAPVIAGSEDGGYTWYLLARFPGSSAVTLAGITPKVLLTSCGCGVVTVSVVASDGTTITSEVYRNVNWGATGCWERIWEDSVQTISSNGLRVITDVACSCANDILAVGQVTGTDPLYFGIHFENTMQGEEQ